MVSSVHRSGKFVLCNTERFTTNRMLHFLGLTTICLFFYNHYPLIGLKSLYAGLLLTSCVSHLLIFSMNTHLLNLGSHFLSVITCIFMIQELPLS